MHSVEKFSSRPAILKDRPQMVDIARRSFEFPMTASELDDMLLQRNTIGKILIDLDGDYVVGYVIYTEHGDHRTIDQLAVDPRFQRRGFGRMLVEDMLGNVSVIRRRVPVHVIVDETNLEGQLFFRACFRPFGRCRVLRRHFGSRDGYEFVREATAPVSNSSPACAGHICG